MLQEKILEYLRKNYYIDDSGYGSLIYFEPDEYPYICKKVLSYIKRGKGRTLEDCIDCYIDDWEDCSQIDLIYELKRDIIDQFELSSDEEDDVLNLLWERISIYPSYKDVYEAIKGLDLYIYLSLDTGDANCEYTPNGDIVKCIHDREFDEIDEDDINRSSLVWLLNQHEVKLIDVDKAYEELSQSLVDFKKDPGSLVQDIAWEIDNTQFFRISKLFFKIKLSVDDYVKLKGICTDIFFEDIEQLSGNCLVLPKGTFFGFGDNEEGWSSITEASIKRDIEVPVEAVNNLIIERIDWYEVNNPYNLGLPEIDDEDVSNYSKLNIINACLC